LVVVLSAALLCGGCAVHLKGLPAAPVTHSKQGAERDPLRALSAPVLSRFLAAQLVLQEVRDDSTGDDRAERAAALLEEAISLSPRQAVLWRYLAQAWASKPDPQRALKAARRAVELDESDAVSRYVLGLQLQRSAAYAQAEEQLLAALTYGLGVGSEYLPHYYLYEVRRQGGDSSGALDALSDWSRALPDSSDPLVLRAKLLWRLGRGEEAATAAAEALRAEPRSAESLKILLDATVLRPLTAIASIQSALKADWSVKDLHYNLIALYRSVGRFDRALEHLGSLRTLSAVGAGAFFADEARLLLAMSQGDEALAFLDDALAAGRSVDGQFVDLMVNAYQVLTMPDEGVVRLRELAESFPTERAQIEQGIAVLSETPRPRSVPPREGLETVEKIEAAIVRLGTKWQFDKPPTSSEGFSRRLALERQRIDLQLLLSFAQREQGDRQASELILLDLLSRHPTLAIALNALAYLWAEDGRRLEEALRLQGRALQQQPFSGAYQDTMGWIQFRRGRLDEALRHIEEADRLQPHEPEIIEHLAEVLRASGMEDEAAEHFRRAEALRVLEPPR